MGCEKVDGSCMGVYMLSLGCQEGLWGLEEGGGGCRGICMGRQGAQGCWRVQGDCKGSESACVGLQRGSGGLCKGTMRTARALHRVLQLSMCHPQPCLPCCSTALVPPDAEHNRVLPVAIAARPPRGLSAPQSPRLHALLWL